jgi:hypothetical protein
MKMGAVLMALWATLLPLAAQVTVEVVLDQDKFLPAEQLMAGVRIVNRSGQVLHLGEDADWVQFSIERLSGGAVEKLSDPPVQGGFDLASTKQATMRVDLAPCYDLRQAGRYTITATVRIKDWNENLTTKPVTFDIIEGTKLWEETFGVPRQPGDSEPPEVRKYTLQQANYLRKELRLYLRVSAADGSVIKLLNVGPMISFGQPEQRLDSQSRLHLLYQNAAKTFAYLVVDYDGDIKVHQTYEYTDTRPRLRTNDTGEITVLGGARHTSASDVPKSEKLENEAAQPPKEAPGTNAPPQSKSLPPKK